MFFVRHWKTIAALAGSTLAFATVIGLALFAPVAIPTVAALFVAGFASGGAYYAISHLLDGVRLTVGGFLASALTSAVFSVATEGVGRLVVPLIGKAVAPASNLIPDPLAPHVWETAATNAIAGAVFGSGTTVLKNAVAGRPLDRNLADATAYGVISGLLVDPAERIVTAAGLPVHPAATEVPPEPHSGGFVRALGKAEAAK